MGDILPDGRLLAMQKGEGEDEINRLDLPSIISMR